MNRCIESGGSTNSHSKPDYPELVTILTALLGVLFFISCPAQSEDEKLKSGLIHTLKEPFNTLEAAKKATAQMRSPLGGLSQGLQNLHAPLEELRKPIAKLEAPIEKLEKPIADLKPPIVGLTVPLTGIETSTGILHERVQELQGQVSGLSGNVSQLEKPLGEISGPLASLGEPISNLHKRIEGLARETKELRLIIIFLCIGIGFSIIVAAMIIAGAIVKDKQKQA